MRARSPRRRPGCSPTDTFIEAANDPGDARYIWSPEPAPRFVASPGRRGGFFLTNFLPCQPAPNYGYARPDPGRPWKSPVDAPGPRSNRRAIREVMAYSLVKDDPGQVQTSALWREMRTWLDSRFPAAVLVAEWSQPGPAVRAGFHADFFLHFRGEALRSLWDNAAGVVRPDCQPVQAYFDAAGGGSAATFVNDWDAATQTIAGAGYSILPTANHDFSRLACGPRAGAQLNAAFALQMTWPSIPAVYYGDEIGMRFLPDLPDKEGSRLAPGNNRAGSRTPMQWDDGPKSGFSAAPSRHFYLPIDPDPARPTVAHQRGDARSLLHTVRRLIALRRAHSGLGTVGSRRCCTPGIR